MSLAEKNAAHARKIIESVGPHMDRIAIIADQVKQTVPASRIREQRALLDSDTFSLIVLGRFRNGKSTFLNALLCEFAHPVTELPANQGPMPVSDLPTTAVMSVISFDRNTRVDVKKTDGRTEKWSLPRYLDEARIKRDQDESDLFFAPILYFDVKLPSVVLQSGITLYDGPGTDDIAKRTEMIDAAKQKCDAGIVVLRSDSLGGEDERRFIQSTYDCGLTNLFFIVNRRDGRIVDEDIKQEAWNRIVNLVQGGPKYTGQNLASKNIYFVDAKAALYGRLEKDTRRLAESGILEFEAALSEFLERDRRGIHLERFTNGVLAHARRLDEMLVKLINGLSANAEEMRKQYELLKPQIDDLRKRMQRLPKIVERNCEKAITDREASFRQMVNDLCRDLPSELRKKKIPSIDDANVFGRIAIGFRKKKVYNETSHAAREICDAHVTAWWNAAPPEPGAQAVMQSILNKMIEEISEEVRDIRKKYEVIQNVLTNTPPDLSAPQDNASEWTKRIIGGALSLVSPDYGVSYLNGGIGGLGRSLLVHTGAAAIVLFIGGPIGWALAAGIGAGLACTAIFAPEKMKEQIRLQVVEAYINGAAATKESRCTPGLREMADDHAPIMRIDVEKFFAGLEAGLQNTAQMESEAEETALQTQLSNAGKGIEEKLELVKLLTKHRTDVKASCNALSDALMVVQSRQ